MSAIKIKRAQKMSTIGDCPGAFCAMVEAIPREVVAALTSAQLARAIDAMWTACGHAKALGARDACDEGAIWDAARGRLREIAA